MGLSKNIDLLTKSIALKNFAVLLISSFHFVDFIIKSDYDAFYVRSSEMDLTRGR